MKHSISDTKILQQKYFNYQAKYYCINLLVLYKIHCYTLYDNI
jgi:hypothetical protein